MQIVFNGQSHTLNHASCSLDDLLENEQLTLGVPRSQAVVAVNQNFIHKDLYAEYEIKDGDEIEMLTAVVGG